MMQAMADFIHLEGARVLFRISSQIGNDINSHVTKMQALAGLTRLKRQDVAVASPDSLDLKKKSTRRLFHLA